MIVYTNAASYLGEDSYPIVCRSSRVWGDVGYDPTPPGYLRSKSENKYRVLLKGGGGKGGCENVRPENNF